MINGQMVLGKHCGPKKMFDECSGNLKKYEFASLCAIPKYSISVFARCTFALLLFSSDLCNIRSRPIFSNTFYCIPRHNFKKGIRYLIGYPCAPPGLSCCTRYSSAPGPASCTASRGAPAPRSASRYSHPTCALLQAP